MIYFVAEGKINSFYVEEKTKTKLLFELIKDSLYTLLKGSAMLFEGRETVTKVPFTIKMCLMMSSWSKHFSHNDRP